MNDPIAPPPELIEDWIEASKQHGPSRPMNPNTLAELAAEWGYRQAFKTINRDS